MIFQWQDYDDLMPFEEVLKRIREKRITNVKVTFEDNSNRLHYKIEGEMDDAEGGRLLGFREPPHEKGRRRTPYSSPPPK